MDPSDRIDNIYFSQDFPVLAAIARWEGAGRPDQHLRPETIAEQMGRPLDEVIQSIGRLYHSGLVDAADATTFGGEDYMVRRLTGAGLQESGLWPKPADLATALHQVLEREVHVTARTDPERSRKMQVILDTLSDLGAAFAAKFAADLLKILTGGH
ncbi:MAG TPA: hypothetical protein VIO37_11140 [Candidatus Dormibacteraeota bacterium]